MEADIVLWPGWETVRLIGRGSFGSVYEIKRDVLGVPERCALKVISIPHDDNEIDNLRSEGYDNESITETFKSYLDSFLHEYALMSRLNGSANIVNCKDVKYIQHDDGFGWDLYIRMELLTPFLKAFPGTLEEKTVLGCARDLCKALEICEESNIVHRDIKPQNIFVSDKGIFKLGDFGIAKVMEGTNTGSVAGTYRYMAPEVAKAEAYGKSADIYSLGLVLYWMLNERRLPFLPLPPLKLQAGDDDKARSRRLSGDAIPAPLNGSNELRRIVLKACAYRPEDRYRNASDMLKDIERLLQSQGQETEPEDDSDQTIWDGHPYVAVSKDVSSVPAPVSDSPVKAISFRKSLVLAIATLFLIAAVIGAAIVLKNQNRAKQNSFDDSSTSEVVPGSVQDFSGDLTLPQSSASSLVTEADTGAIPDNEEVSSEPDSSISAAEAEPPVPEPTYTDSFKNASISVTGNAITASLITPGIDEEYEVDSYYGVSGMIECSWEILFTDGVNIYSVSTSHKNRNKSNPNEIIYTTIDKMQHVLTLSDKAGKSLSHVAFANLSVDGNKLTWEVAIPESYGFVSSDIRIIQYKILIPAQTVLITETR